VKLSAFIEAPAKPSTQAQQHAPAGYAYARNPVFGQLLPSALFRKRELDVFVREDSTNFDMTSKGADVISQRPEFDFGTLFQSGDFALLHLHGERNLSLSHLAVLTQFVKCHAFENRVGALFCSRATRLTHELVRDAVVGEGLVCHTVLSHVLDAGLGSGFPLQGPQVFAVKLVSLTDQLFVKAAPSVFVATDEQDGGALRIEGKERAQCQMFVMRGAQLFHVGKCRAFDRIDIGPSEDRTLFLEKVYGSIERLTFFPSEGLHPFPELRRGTNFVSHTSMMRCNLYEVKLIFFVPQPAGVRRCTSEL
jgi:hypothetical protein